MKVIGLTGPPAAGKSTVARALELDGFPVIDCDKLGHGVYEPGTKGLMEVVRAFGTDIMGADGKIDRRALGALVFSDKEKLNQLNKIVWPHIRKRAEEEVARYEANGEKAVVLEAAVLLQAGWEDICTELWAVIAPKEECAQRVSERSGGRLSLAEAEKRVASAVDEGLLRDAANVVLETGRGALTEEKLKEVARRLAAEVVEGVPHRQKVYFGGEEKQGQNKHEEVDDRFVVPSAAIKEDVAVFDRSNNCVGSASREEMRRDNLRHRASFVFVRTLDGQVLVQKRAAVKDYFPSHFEAAAGGVVAKGEEDDMDGSARRELEEEFGIASNNLQFLFWHLHEDKHTRVWCAAYDVVVPRDVPLHLQEEEVASVEWMTPEEIAASVRRGDKWTPDGLVIWDLYNRRHLEPLRQSQAFRRGAAFTLGALALGGLAYYVWTQYGRKKSKN